jgi:hypothetical protein
LSTLKSTDSSLIKVLKRRIFGHGVKIEINKILHKYSKS